MNLRTTWLEPTGTVRYGLRRASRPRPVAHFADGFARQHYTGWHPPPCDGREHEAIVWTGEGHAQIVGVNDSRRLADRYPTPRDDPEWPVCCARCGERFGSDGAWQDVVEPLYTDGGKVYLLSTEHNPPDAPPAPDGSMWDGWWLPKEWHGPDRVALVVRCPGGLDFMPDRPTEVTVKQNQWRSQGWLLDTITYRWQREGDPRRGRVTVHPEFEVGERGQPGYWFGRLTEGEFRPG